MADLNVNIAKAVVTLEGKMGNLKAVLSGAGKNIRTFSTKAKQVIRKGVEDAFKKLKKTAQSFSKFIKIGMVASLGALVVATRTATKAADEQARVNKQLEAVLASTGGAAGLTAEEIKEMANQFQKLTPISNEAVQAGQNMLLTFTNISKDVFPETTAVLLDMTTAMQGGAIPTAEQLRTQAIQLGKAMNDPIEGISALTRVGVKFTDAQKEMITTMAEAGDVTGAQKMILKELNKEFGGAAQAQAQTFAGRITQIKEALSDVFKEAGFVIQKFAGIGISTKNIIGKIEQFGLTIKKLGENQKFIDAVKKAIGLLKDIVVDTVTAGKDFVKEHPIIVGALAAIAVAVLAINSPLLLLGSAIALIWANWKTALLNASALIAKFVQVITDKVDGLVKDVLMLIWKIPKTGNKVLNNAVFLAKKHLGRISFEISAFSKKVGQTGKDLVEDAAKAQKGLLSFTELKERALEIAQVVADLKTSIVKSSGEAKDQIAKDLKKNEEKLKKLQDRIKDMGKETVITVDKAGKKTKKTIEELANELKELFDVVDDSSKKVFASFNNDIELIENSFRKMKLVYDENFNKEIPNKTLMKFNDDLIVVRNKAIAHFEAMNESLNDMGYTSEQKAKLKDGFEKDLFGILKNVIGKMKTVTKDGFEEFNIIIAQSKLGESMKRQLESSLISLRESSIETEKVLRESTMGTVDFVSKQSKDLKKDVLGDIEDIEQGIQGMFTGIQKDTKTVVQEIANDIERIIQSMRIEEITRKQEGVPVSIESLKKLDTDLKSLLPGIVKAINKLEEPFRKEYKLGTIGTVEFEEKLREIQSKFVPLLIKIFSEMNITTESGMEKAQIFLNTHFKSLDDATSLGLRAILITAREKTQKINEMLDKSAEDAKKKAIKMLKEATDATNKAQAEQRKGFEREDIEEPDRGFGLFGEPAGKFDLFLDGLQSVENKTIEVAKTFQDSFRQAFFVFDEGSIKFKGFEQISMSIMDSILSTATSVINTLVNDVLKKGLNSIMSSGEKAAEGVSKTFGQALSSFTFVATAAFATVSYLNAKEEEKRRKKEQRKAEFEAQKRQETGAGIFNIENALPAPTQQISRIATQASAVQQFIKNNIDQDITINQLPGESLRDEAKRAFDDATPGLLEQMSNANRLQAAGAGNIGI